MDWVTVPIRKQEIEHLSADIRRMIDGQDIDLRHNQEGVLNILRNDIHTLAALKDEQLSVLQHDRELLKTNLADISHQLKTPLTSMMIMADLLESSPAHKQQEFIANIRSSLARMDWLVGALLKMAKLDAGTIEFRYDTVRSAELITSALEPLAILLELKNQTVEQTGAAELICDRRWLTEALTNIIKNASEHSPDNSVIKIAAGSDPLCTWIGITDSGVGISKADIAKLYRRFEGSTHDTGYGIGLPLALAIVRGQNGDIEVQAGGHGQGACFTIKLYKQQL